MSSRWIRTPGLRALGFVVCLLAGVLLAAGCGGEGSPDPAEDGAARGAPAADSALADAPSPERAVEPRADGEGSGQGPGRAAGPVDVLFVGTSLTEGWGLDDPRREAWPWRLVERARQEGFDLEARNAGLSGETSAGALRRIGWVLEGIEPGLVVLETGANDGLRALSVEELESNLAAVADEIRARLPEACIALVAMEAPPNLGPRYTEEFRQVYPTVAERQGLDLLPFPLEGVAGDPSLNLEDGIHPTAEGHQEMADTLWPALRPLLERCTTTGDPDRPGSRAPGQGR